MVSAGIEHGPQKAGKITRWTKGFWEAVHPYSADGAYGLHDGPWGPQQAHGDL